jgi:hypothetical protein
MIKALYLMASLSMLVWALPAMGDACDGGGSGILYSIHYENGTVLNVTEGSMNFSELNNSTMKFLENIDRRVERAPTSEGLEKELAGTKYLVVTSEKSMQIPTKLEFKPGVFEGYTITTKKIVIKLQKEIFVSWDGSRELDPASGRIFTFHEPEDVGAPIRPWASALSVDTIKI